MISKKEFERKVSLLGKDEERLAEYFELILREKPDLLLDHVPTLESFLFRSENDDWYLRQVALYGLLSKLGIDNEKYFQRGIELFLSNDEDEDVRRRALLGLSKVYFGSKRRYLLQALFDLMFNEVEDMSLRITSFVSLLNVYGIESNKINVRAIDPIFTDREDYFDRNLPLFDNEMKSITTILSN